jgi:cyclic pyranopterin phosphate synthase
MSVREIERVARVCVRLGVRRVRITGGEPTVHPRLDDVVARLASLGVADLSMTTNGDVVTEEAAARWKRLGLRRLTLSLDTLRPERFSAITRSASSPERVLRAIRAAKTAGLDPVRVNAVIIRGRNDDEVADLAGLAREMDVEVRLIEYMPLDAGHAWDRALVVTADEMREQIEARHALRPIGRETKSGTALNYRFADGAPGGIGLIAPVSRPFCGACSRLRITADAKVRPCLFSRTEYDLRPLLRGDARDDDLAAFIADAVWTKQAKHGISSPGFVQPERTMSAIGG